MATQAQATKLAELRAHLAEAEHVVENLAEDATAEVRTAAEATKADAGRALGEFKVALEKAEAEVKKLETRPEPKVEETREEPGSPVKLQALVQAATTQNVRGTDALTPEQHAARRNPR